MNLFSLYINIPFCSSFCDYCDFYSELITNNLDDNIKIDIFLSSLISDIKQQIEYYDVDIIPTVYIGGGTPSVLGKKIKILLDALKQLKGFSPEEFTIEANPLSLTDEFLDACCSGGVNRLSVGIQTFHDISRAAVNRGGNAETIEKYLKKGKEYFPHSLSVDMMTGLPFQTEEIVKTDLNHLLTFKPQHISLYSLNLENNTPLEKNILLKKICIPGQDEADTMWLSGCDILKKAGYEHYEVSNFSLPDKKCRHNLRYWNMESWLGAGPAASGTIINEKEGLGVRYTYPENLNDYNGYFNSHSKNNYPWLNSCKNIEKKELIKETLLMGYRTNEGPDKDKFLKRFNMVMSGCIPKTLDKWKNKNKMLFLNSFLSEAFIELDKN